MSKIFKKNIKTIQNYAENLIPGLSGLLGKRPEMYLPGGEWPTYYKKARGIEIWDIKSKKYLDFTMHGVGSCALGYSDPDINKIAKDIIQKGSLTTLNPPEEIELAEMLIKFHPWAEQVKYARTGGEIMSIAARLARAHTGKDKILICGYHGWHDWYLSANLNGTKNLNNHLLPGLNPLGVPRNLKNTIIPFNFNCWTDYREVVEKNIKDCAAVIIEPARNEIVNKKFIRSIRNLTKKNNCLLIFDEITCAWRHETSGIHKEIGIDPDIATFGKTMANGIPMAAIIGKKDIMRKSLDTFISSTNWTERLGPACSVAFLKKHMKLNLGKILIKNGSKIRKIWEKNAKKNNLKIDISGILPLSSFKILNVDWPLVLTFFIQEMMDKKILASDRCYSNYAQKDKYLLKYDAACDEAFYKINKFTNNETIKSKLRGPIKQMGFHRLT